MYLPRTALNSTMLFEHSPKSSMSTQEDAPTQCRVATVESVRVLGGSEEIDVGQRLHADFLSRQRMRQLEDDSVLLFRGSARCRNGFLQSRGSEREM